jgi:hypothetical protein
MVFDNEAHFRQWVIAAARFHGWRVAVPNPSYSDPGFPDLVLIGGEGRVILAELKVPPGALKPGQRATLDALRAAGHEAYVWKPTDEADIARTLAGDEAGASATPEPLSVVGIAALVARHFGVPTEAVVGPSRTDSLVRVRHLAMLLARTKTAATLPEIGRAFNRNHTTVMHGCDAARVRIDSDPAAHSSWERLSKDIDSRSLGVEPRAKQRA